MRWHSLLANNLGLGREHWSATDGSARLLVALLLSHLGRGGGQIHVLIPYQGLCFLHIDFEDTRHDQLE